MPTLDLVKNSQYVAKSLAKKRAQVGDQEYSRLEEEEKRIYRGKKKASKASFPPMVWFVYFQ